MASRRQGAATTVLSNTSTHTLFDVTCPLNSQPVQVADDDESTAARVTSKVNRGVRIVKV